MNTTSDLVYQFLIVLSEVEPLVWRRIQVPGIYSFWDLHVAIQDSMGWYDSHLHVFRVFDPDTGQVVEIGIPDDEGISSVEQLPGHLLQIADYFSLRDDVASYVYDFGDDWRHVVAFESWLMAEKGIEYPRCISGENRCPPEDCGGPVGYERFLEAIGDPDHEEHESYLEWIGGSFDPEDFDPDQIIFDDPKERWEFAFGQD
ncbi:MAG: plasmid pRiA4b ORF-3 family protein [Anaerolineales bacterium]